MIDSDDDTEDTLTENVTLAVYRKNFDGTYTELVKELPNDKCHWILDPHPSMDVGRYRIVATSTLTGQSEYGDYEEEGIGGEIGVIIQWNEFYDNPEYDSEEDAFNNESENHWAASSLHLIYNIDIADNNSLDVSLVKYIPNVVEVVYSSNSATYYSRVENTDENSPVSIQSRGRQIIYRDTSPSLTGVPTKEIIDDYAKQLLKSLSTLKYQLTFKHGYYPVRVGDCVRLNYRRAGLSDVKAYITNQSITCEPGCPIEETAVYTKELWGG